GVGRRRQPVAQHRRERRSRRHERQEARVRRPQVVGRDAGAELLQHLRERRAVFRRRLAQQVGQLGGGGGQPDGLVGQSGEVGERPGGGLVGGGAAVGGVGVRQRRGQGGAEGRPPGL